jgi:hypothetical protein
VLSPVMTPQSGDNIQLSKNSSLRRFAVAALQLKRETLQCKPLMFLFNVESGLPCVWRSTTGGSLSCTAVVTKRDGGTSVSRRDHGDSESLRFSVTPAVCQPLGLPTSMYQQTGSWPVDLRTIRSSKVIHCCLGKMKLGNARYSY